MAQLVDGVARGSGVVNQIQPYLAVQLKALEFGQVRNTLRQEHNLLQ